MNMLRKFILFALFITLTLCSCNAFAREYVVKKILDGDTIELDSGEIVKYIGVDAPQRNRKEGTSEFYGKEAVRFNKRLVFMKKVRLEFDQQKKDPQGRLLAYVFVKKTFVNAELIKNGCAKANVVSPNVKYKGILLEAEKKAIEEDRGIWQEKKKDTEESYIGNKRTQSFHRPSCKNAAKVPEKNKIIFHNRSDAIKIGYIPCKVCKP